jgi:4-hydroxy-tetrahydrodipicolinate synthase
MPTSRTFFGVIAPVATPFGEDGQPDPERFVAHAQWLLANGCTALAPFGTTSEANSLGLEERMQMLEELVDAGIAPDVLMPGTGMCALPDAVTLTQHAVDLGCGGCLMLPPFYYKNPSEEGLYRFFAHVIDAVGDPKLKVYLYHIPPIAQVGFALPLIGRLLRHYPDTILGLKDSSGDWGQTAAFLKEYPNLEIFPGAETFLLDGLKAGGAGTISATANVQPGALRAVIDAHGTDAADGLQAKITAVRAVLQSQPLIPLVKGLIAHARRDPAWAAVRPPLTALPAETIAATMATLTREHGFEMRI